MKTGGLTEQELATLPCIHEGRNCLLYLQTDSGFGKPIVIKIPRHDASPQLASRLANEHHLTAGLELSGVRRSCARLTIGGRPALALEYVEGDTLQQAYVEERRSLAENLEVAIAVATILEGAHRRHLVHRNLGSSHILVSSTPRTVTLIDFGGASLASQGGGPETADLPASSLAYVSPEQTGRINRFVDLRADLYSFGAVLYEVFTGQHLCNSDDPAELLHWHLAQKPVPPRQVNPEVPGPISDIILRLLAKNADDRYQSAFGVIVDLENCLSQVQQNSRIGDLKLGQSDYSSVFRLPDKLYGRDEELRVLKEAVKGAGRAVLISGLAGVGKTALVSELQRYSTERGAYFVTGRYDGSQRHVPYTGLFRAFGELMDLVLTESAGQLAHWKARILEAVGGNGGLLIEILPRLELIIGPQPPAPELAPAEAQHRFHHLLQSFTFALARGEHPLVLFLDNLQWADQASLHLLSLLLPRLDRQPMVFLGAYRSDEVGAGHSLAALLDILKPLQGIVRMITLENLLLEALERLIAEALKIEVSCAQPLAQLVLEKTAGNALFVRQFLLSLHEDDHLKFCQEGRRWTWDTEGIQKLEVTGSGALMAQKIEKLPGEAQGLLSIAACIGSRFELGILAGVTESPAWDVAHQVLAAVEAGLVQSLAASGVPGAAAEGLGAEPATHFEFSRDRVRQAAYALLPRKQRRLIHLKLGRLLLEQTPESALEGRIFEIADQFNEGFQHIKEEWERRQLVELNLMAGRKAKRAAAYQAAIRYLSMGIGMLLADRWERGAELTLNLFMEAIEAEYLSTNFERAALLSTEVLEHCQDLFTRVRVYELRILFLTAQNQNGAAILAGLKALDELDMALPTQTEQIEEAAVRRSEDLARLPEMIAPRHLAIMRILMHLTTPAHRTDPVLLKATIAGMLQLSMRHGNSPMAAFAYGWHGVLLCSGADIETGYRFGQLSLEVLRRFFAPDLEVKVAFLFNTFVRHWKEHARDCIEPLQNICRRSVEAGDLELTYSCAIHYCGYLFCTGAPLQQIRREQTESLEAMERSRLPFHSQLARIWGQTVANLCGGTGDPCRLIGNLFDESKSLPSWIDENESLLVFSTLSCRTMLQYLFGDYAGAAASGRLAEDYAEAAQSFLYRANHCFYYALALLAHGETAAPAERAAYLHRVAPLSNQLQHWAALAPLNYAHKLALVEAERARITGENGRAMECFNNAIRLARANGYAQDEALAYEREAVFFTALGREEMAGLSLRKAVDAFKSWGALGKVESLERRFKLLAQQGPVPLDTAVVVKASRMLSQEIRLEHLLEKLMRIVIENAGAEKGILILKSGTGLALQARGDIERVETMQSAPVETCGEVALSVVNYVARTHSQIVLGDACRDRTFGTDKYIAEHRTRSLLCIPILYQGKLSGILYLENNLATHVFTADRLELLRALASQAAISMENATLYADQEDNFTALKQAEGKLRATNQRLVEEIEERKRTGEALRQSEQRFRVVFDQTFQFIGLLTTDGILLQANQTALQFADVGEDGVLGRLFWETPWWLHCPELQQRLRAAIQEAATGTLVRFEATHCAPGGLLRNIDFSMKPITDARGRVVQLIAEGRDITERKQAEEALQSAHDQLEIRVEQRTAELTRVNQLMREEIAERQKADKARLEAQMERDAVEVQLRQAQKLEAIGQLAAGIAHEINTPTQYVGDNIRFIQESFRSIAEICSLYDQMLRAAKTDSVTPELLAHVEQTVEDEDLRFALREIPEAIAQTLDGVERITRIVRAMKEFSHPSGRDRAPADLNRAIESTVTVAQNKWKYVADVTLDLDPQLPRVACFLGEFNQAILNLIVNAANAIEEVVERQPDQKGRITVSTRQDGDMIEVRVSDTGAGIEESIRPRIFEPFFTTKEVGKGTGQGLSIAYGTIVKRHGGTLGFESEVGKGTTFMIRLPIGPNEAEAQSTGRSPKPACGEPEPNC